MDLSTSETSTKSALALRRCQHLIDRYGKLKRHNRIAYKVSAIVAIVFSGLTPVLVLWSGLPEVLQALPAAVAAIVTGLSGIFQWKDNYVRFGYTKEQLESEAAKFETRATELYGPEVDDLGAVDNFVERVEGIVMAELSDWRTRIQQATKKA